jgi:hypothetical protein
MTRATSVLMAAFMGLALAGCDVPADPEHTTDTVRGQTLVVGVTTDDEPSDPDERAAIERLAQRLDATVEYRRDEIHRQVKALEEGEIHLLAGHLPKTTPFAKETGTTVPVSSMLLGGKRVKTVFALRKGENGFLVETEKAIGGAK